MPKASFQIAQGVIIPPRESPLEQVEGQRTMEMQPGGERPVSVDNQGNYVYSNAIYGVFIAALIAMMVVGFVLSRARKRLQSIESQALKR